MAEPELEQNRSSRRVLIRWGKYVLQILILCLITYGLWGTFEQAFHQLQAKGVSIWKVHYGWLTVAGLGYLVGMFPVSLFWHRVMLALQQHVPKWPAVAAHYVSQLGKYVPGKIMVLVIRCAMVRRYGVNKTLTVASIFVETLTMMSVGAVLGAILLAFTLSDDWRMIAFAVVASACVGAPTLPPVFLRVVKWTKLHRLHPEIDQSLAGLNWHVLWPGWIAIAAGWIAMGFSLWATLKALPQTDVQLSMPEDLAIVIACVALSTVAGFVSGLPGGIGAREWVVIQLVQPQFGPSAAVLSAILHRVVMLVAELIVVAIIFVLAKIGPKPNPSVPPIASKVAP